jgi:hypothetical protein
MIVNPAWLDPPGANPRVQACPDRPGPVGLPAPASGPRGRDDRNRGRDQLSALAGGIACCPAIWRANGARCRSALA